MRDKLTTKDCPTLGVKFDGGKRQWNLLPWAQIGEVVDVLTFGVRKYAPDNWMYVDNAKERYLSAAMRHITARIEGEIYDPETDKPHLAHAICCLLFWMWHDANGRKHDGHGSDDGEAEPKDHDPHRPGR